jgi:glycosyltransferase involved in cell wall biosynthesis
MNEPNFSVVAMGHPSDPRTFSGYSRALTRELHIQDCLRYEYDANPQRFADKLRALALVQKRPLRLHPHYSRRWLWSRRGPRLLSDRLAEKIRRNTDRGPFLQIGTLVEIPAEFGPHFMLTDMTIPQARRANQFRISELSDADLDIAVGVQAQRFEEAAHIFVLSEWTAASVREDFGVSCDRITVVYAGSNLELPSGVVDKRRPREILFVGIDWERKGGPLLAEAFAIVRRAVPDARLTIVGCSPPLSGEGIQIEGFLSKRDPAQLERLARCYQRASCFCLPTLFDPFPNAIIEAASVGLPCVAVDNGSRREAIVEGTGLLADRAEPEAVADALIELLRDPERTAAMGIAAKAHAEANFTWGRVVSRIVAVAKGQPPVAAERP